MSNILMLGKKANYQGCNKIRTVEENCKGMLNLILWSFNFYATAWKVCMLQNFFAREFESLNAICCVCKKPVPAKLVTGPDSTN